MHLLRLVTLELAIDRGYDDSDQLRNEPELASLRRLPEWSELMDAAQRFLTGM